MKPWGLSLQVEVHVDTGSEDQAMGDPNSFDPHQEKGVTFYSKRPDSAARYLPSLVPSARSVSVGGNPQDSGMTEQSQT